MFYLKVFWESICNNKVNGIIFSLLTFSIVYLINNEAAIRSNLAQKYIKDDQKIFFRATVPESVNATEVVIRMRKMPGVLGVYQERGNKLKNNIQKNLDENGIYIPRYLLEQDIRVIEVVLNNEISKKNHEMIKSYLLKYIDSGETVVSSIHYPPEDSLRTFLVSFFLKWTIKIFVGLLTIFFCFSYFSFIKTIFQQSYIYQNYQRKVNIAPKSLFSGLAITLGLSYMMIAIISDISLLTIPAVLAFIGLFYFIFSKILLREVRYEIN